MRLEDKVRNRLEIHHPTSWRCEANASLAIAFPRPTYTFERVKGVLLEEERGGAQAGREARLNPYTPHHQVRTGMHSCQCLVLVPLSFTERESARARAHTCFCVHHLYLCTPKGMCSTTGLLLKPKGAAIVSPPPLSPSSLAARACVTTGLAPEYEQLGSCDVSTPCTARLL